MTANPTSQWGSNPQYSENLRQYLNSDGGKLLLDIITYYGLTRNNPLEGDDLFKNLILEASQKRGVAQVLHTITALSQAQANYDAELDTQWGDINEETETEIEE